MYATQRGVILIMLLGISSSCGRPVASPADQVPQHANVS
jgi:hypothetical protein